MFTGLVETTGVLRSRAGRSVFVGGSAPKPLGARARIEAALGPLTLGESVNVQGACLTVDRIVDGGFECDMSAETLTRTTLGERPLGSRVHLERATPVGGRLGGHLVLGHVDGVGLVTAREPSGDAVRLEVRAPGELERLVAPKGSICLDGASLTLNAVGRAGPEGVTFDVMLVPHTIARTLLGDLRPGSRVNVEVDVLARYVARHLETRAPDGDHDDRILAALRAGGYA